MKKTAVLAVCAAICAGAVQAESTLTLDCLTSYLWRGQVYNTAGVLQPGMEARTTFGLSAAAWANMDLTGKNDLRGKFTEVDLTVAYALPLRGPVVVKLGMINYLFPYHSEQISVETKVIEDPETHAQSTVAEHTIKATPATSEIFGSVEIDVLLTPTLAVYRDIDEAKGWYVNAGVSQSHELTDKITLKGLASLGWGCEKYNEYYFGSDKAEFNDLNLGAEIGVQVVEDLTLAGAAAYTVLLGSDVKDNAKEIYHDNKRFYGGLKLAYVF